MIRVRVAGILRHDGRVLLGQRPDADPAWVVPGGGVQAGEDSQAALAREFREELNLDAEIGPLVCVGENAYTTAQGIKVQSFDLYFLVGAHSAPPDGFASPESGLRFCWFDSAALARLDLRPEPLRDLLTGPWPPSALRHFRCEMPAASKR